MALLFAIVVIIPCSSSIRVETQYDVGPFEPFTVSINDIGLPGLQFRCQSGDDDLGYHTLNTMEECHFSFTVDFWDNTLFFCHFYWNSKDLSFVVFDTSLQPK